MKRLLDYFALFGSLGTILCCALPALLVGLGLGATFAGLISVFPQIVWVSEHKAAIFIITGLLLLASAVLQYRARRMACPPDPKLAAACGTSRGVSRWVFGLSLALYLVGGFFAFVLPRLVL